MNVLHWRAFLACPGRKSLRTACALIVGLAAFLLLSQNGEIQPRLIAGTFSTVTGILLGFLVTALTVLTAVSDRRLSINMQKTGHYRHLFDRIFESCVLLFAALVIALVCLFLPTSAVTGGVALCAAVLSAGLAAFVEAGWKFRLFVQNLN